jgi:hypothetical protein
MQIKIDILKYETEERENLLYRYNEKIASAKIMLEEWRKACKEVQVKFLRAHDENQNLQKLIDGFKSNDNVNIDIQKYH